MQVIDKVPTDNRQYAIFCAPLLLNGATIATIGTPSVFPAVGLSFQAPTVNAAPLTAEIEGQQVTAQIGTAIQVWISAGTIPANQPYIGCTVYIPFTTTAGETLTAMATLRLVNQPGI